MKKKGKRYDYIRSRMGQMLRTGMAGRQTLQSRGKRAAGMLLIAGWFMCLGGFLSLADSSGETEMGLSEEKDRLLRYSEITDTREELSEPDELWTDEKGNEWKLDDSRVILVPVTGRHRRVSGEVVYPKVTRNAEIPETAVMEVLDEESGEWLEASLPLIDTSYGKERWEGDLDVIVTFHSYGSDVYTLGETKVSHVSAQPPLKECEKELLSVMGMTEEDCRLEEFFWAGEPYPDENGILCRDAGVHGSRRVWDCRAVYEGEVKLPDVNRYRLELEYIRFQEEAATEVEGSGEAFSTEPLSVLGEAEEERESFGQWLLRHGLEVSVSLSLLLLALLGFVLLRRRAKTLDGKN